MQTLLYVLYLYNFIFFIIYSFFDDQESERKAYNPQSFCNVYTMDKQPLNTGEQKDMTEFFTDLISKLEEMSPELVRTGWDQTILGSDNLVSDNLGSDNLE